MSNTILQSYTLPDGTVLNPNDMAQALLSTIAQAPQRQVLTPEPTQEAASPLVSYAPQEQQAVKGRSVAEHIKNGGSKDALTIAEVARQEVANLEANKKYDNLDKDHPIVNTAQLENTNPLISVPANLANMSLAVAATANNIYRNIKTIPDTVDAAMIESTVSDQVKEAYSTVMRFNADRTVLAREYDQVNDQLKENPNDKKLLTRKSEIESENKSLKVDDWVISLLNTRNPKTGNTFREDLDNAQAIRKAVLEERGYEADGKTPNALNTKEWYNQRNMQNLQENVAGDPNVINAKTDTAKLGNAFMSAFDNATNNLTTVPTTIAESIPYFVAPATGAVSALTDQAAKSTAQFTAREGRLPTGQEKADMALYDLAYAGLNFVGDKLVTTPLGVATKPVEAAVKTPLQMATSLLGSAGRIAAPTVAETMTEGTQTAIEGGLGSLGGFDNPVDVGIGAALGGLSGGVVGTPGAIANEFTGKPTVNPVAPTDTTTDVADLANPQSKSYNPSEAVKRYVFAYSQAENQEDKDQVFNDARQTVNDAQDLLDAQTATYAQYEKVVNGAVTRNEAKLEEILANPELSDESKELYTDLITKANAAMTASYNIVKEATPEVYLASLDKAKATQAELQSQFSRLNKVHNKVNYSTYDATIELEPLPENVSKINSVVDDLTNGLTDDQRNNLRKFSEAIVALNQSKDLDLVTGDIITGSKSDVKNFRGLKEYVQEWNTAQNSGNTNVLNRLYTQLTSFQDSHIKKHKAAKEAFAKVPTGLAIPVWKSGNEWVLAEAGNYRKRADVKGLVENGGMLIHSGSGKLIQRIGTEVESTGKTVDYFNSVKPEEVTVTEDFQSALDDYNNLDRIIRNQYQADKAKKEAERAAKAAEPKAEDKPTEKPVVVETPTPKQTAPVVEAKSEPKKAKTPDQSQVLTELNLSAKQIQDVTSDLKNLVSFETVNTNTNRQTAQLGSDYTYSGKTYEGQPIPTHIQAWMDAVNKALGTAYNSVLVQYYPANTKSGIGFHKDNEKDQFDTNQPVISLSIGQTIPFIVHEKLNTPVTFNLKSGDVFKFDGNKLHGIATQNHTGERYSLTLRQFHIVKVHKTTPPVSPEAVEETTVEETPVVEPTNKVDPKTFTNHSGGAKGYDAEWDIIGAEFGFINNNHYLLPVDGSVADPRLKAKGVKPVDATKDIGQVAATGAAIGEAQIAVTKAERAMGRIEKTHTTRNTKKIRNYAQVKNADGIFAIGSLIPKGADITIAQGKETRVALVPQVNGGTSVAVQLSITMGKPTYVFNQVANSTYAEGWHKWSNSKQDFVPVDTPVLTKNFAGIGTSSNTTEQGKQAIKDVYAKTLSSLDTKAEPKAEDIELATTEISSNAKGLAAALTNPTELAKSKGNITKSYPIEYGGKTYKDAEAVFQAIKDPTESRTKPAREVSNNYSLMVAILKAKLKQYPALVAGITKQGGSKWILAATHQPTSKNTVWETGGENWFILALNEAYLSQVEPSKIADPSTGTVEIPIEEDVNDQDVGTANLNTDPETIATDSESTTIVESTTESVDPVIEDVVDGLTAMQGDKEFERALSEEDNRTESTGYQKANLLVASFKQVKSTFLAANKDFMSWLKEDLLTNAASILGALTPKQEDALVSFSKFNDLHSKKIESFIRNKGADSKFKYQDWIQYLINPDGTIDENIKTAIAASMFSWVAENGGKRYRNMEQVAALFGFKETAIVPLEVFKEFTDAGQFTNQIIQSLGERAYKSLGFKLDKGLSSTRKDKLQSALGTIAYVLMLDGKLLEETSYALDEFREYANMISDASEQEAEKDPLIANNSAYRVYLARPIWENNEPNKFVKRVMDVTRGTQGLMNSLFGTENELRYPSFEPIKGLSQKTISSTGTEIPLDLAQKVKRMQAKPYSVNTNMVNFYQTMSALNQEALLRLLGYVPIEELANKHISTRLEQQAINEGIIRSINNNLDFLGSIEGDIYPDMYMPMKVWEVNRIGIDATVLNEQADKISRSMIGLKDHTVTIDIDSPFNADGTITPFGYYLLALGSNMEEVPLTINTTPDKTTAGLYIPSFLEYINTSPVVAKGVEAMREMRNGGLADLNAIQEAVSEFGMAGLSVMALDSLVDYFDAKAAGTQLTTSLAFESDGVTNGLIISVVAYGAYSTNLLEAGGLYGFDTDTVTNVGYRAKGGKDVYQQIGEAQKEIWSELISAIAANKDNYLSVVVEQFALIANFFDKNFGSRKGAKVATTPFVYGSSFGSINRAISYNFINMIYKAVEDNINNPEGMKTIEDNLNILVDLVNIINRTQLARFNLVNATKEELLDSEFPKAFVKGVAKLDGKLRGKATMFALQRVAGDLIDSRKQVTTLANVGAELFGALYEAMYKVVEAENELNIPTRYMKQDGEMAYVRLEPMSDAMEAEVVSRLLPYDSTIRSANSVFNGKNATEASHRTYNFKRDKYYEYSSNHVFAKAPMLGTRKTYNTPVTKRVIESKGVGISAILIQSMDAFVTATTSSSVAATNHHDANGSSVTGVVKMATIQNQAFTTVQSRYHLASESLNAFFAPLKGMFESNLFSEKDRNVILYNALYTLTKTEKGFFPSLELEPYSTAEALKIVVNNAFNDDIAKLRNLTKVKHVNQYGTEGGQYALTNADRSLLLKEIDKLEIKRQEYLGLVDSLIPQYLKEELKDAKYNKNKFSDKPVKQDTSTKPTEEIKVNESVAQAVPTKPVVQAEPTTKPVVQVKPTTPVILQNSFTKKLTDALGSFITLGDLLPELAKQVKATNGVSIQLSLVALINKGLGKDIKIYVVDANTASNDLDVDISQLQNGKYSGLHTYNSNGEDVIVVRADRANSGLILHEYVHALTVLATKSKEPKAKELIKELTQTMEATKDFYQKNKNTFNDKQKAIIEYALTNLEEFVAEGFSSKIFQEVLMQVLVTKVTNRRFEAKSIFQMFVDSVSKYLGIKASDNTALASLIYNGAALMAVNQNITAKPRQQDLLFSAVDEVDNYSVSDIFDNLNTTSDNDFNSHLKDVFNSAVQGAYSLIQGYDTNQYTPFQVWESLVTEGKAPYSSALGRVGFNLTAQERFVIESLEVSIKAALDKGFNTPVYREMLKVYEDARKTLKPEDFYNGDWSTATEDDKSLANAKYNALFEGNASNGRSDYMSKFIAASLGSKEVRELMDTVVSTRERSSTKKSYYEKLTSFINSIMNWVNGYLTRTLRTDTASGKLPILAKQLIEIKNQRKDGLLNQVLDRISSAQAVSNAYGQLFGKKGADLLNGMAKSKRGSVRGSTKVVQSILRGNFMEDMRVMQDWRDFWHSGKPYGMAAELLSEFAEPSTMREAVYDLIRKHNVLQQHRKRLIDVTKSDLLSLFDNKLTKEERNAISAGMLRTNMQVMLKHIGIKGITEAFKSSAVVDKAIAELTKELNQYEDSEVYKVRAKDLAMYQVKGEGRTGLAKNSDAIARNVGLENYYDVAAKDVVNLIDQYAAFHAIKYMDQSQRQLIVKLLENHQSAMSTVLQYQGSMIKESKDTLFQSSTTNMIDGYLPEITNRHKEISIATSKEEEADLIRLGFKKVADLKMDKNDPFTGEVRAMYATDVSVRQRFVTAAVSITNTARKGTSIFKGNNGDLTPKGLAIAHQLAASRMRKGLAAKAAKADSYDPRMETSSVIPVYRNDGSIMDYRYEMSHAVRDSSVLERNNDFATLLGTYKGGIFDKSHTPTHNKAVFDMIYKDWAAYGDRQRHKFTEVSANSDDPRVAELYKLLPDKTKAYVNGLYGETPLMIRTDLLRPVFGFQKLTIGNMFDKDPDLRGTVENFTVQMVNVLLRNNPKAKVMKAEQAIQDIMAVVKNVIVIRNISTLLGNQTANMSILMARGINPKSIVEDSIEALRAGTQYRKDMSRKVSLEQNLLVGVGNPTAIRNELNRVNDSLNRNPLKEFIAAGMLPTIVEDLDNGQDEYAYTTKFADAIDQKTAFIPKGVKTAAKWAVVAQGTPAYEFLSNATQFSDFMAKYVAYKQVTLREGGTHEEGIRLADKLFIAYDVPTSPQLQYLNDMGLVMFTKYYIRIQRAMFYLLKNYPTTSLAQTLLAASGNYAGALDPSMLGGIGNPFTTSILGVPSAAIEPFPIKMLLGF